MEKLILRTRTNYKIIGADFSAQEPRLTAFYSQDPNMIKAYAENKDLYAVIASMSFDYPYDECLEFYPEGTKIMYEGSEVICGQKTHQNKDGKQRRNMAKAILLGLLYGRGANSIAEQTGKTKEEAQDIINKFYESFPQVKDWIDATMKHAHELGYVEDIAGRRRRLPDILLPRYDIKLITKNKVDSTFNPLLHCAGLVESDSNKIIAKYKDLVSKCRGRQQVEELRVKALAEQIEIRDNTGFIAQAERQSVNSRVQGGAATLTKSALIDIYNDSELRDLGAYLINTVHDEILVEAPEAVATQVAKRLCALMIASAKKYVPNVPMKVDDYIVSAWYLDEFAVLVEKEFKQLIDNGLTELEAFEEECEQRGESTRSQIYELVKGYMHSVPVGVDVTYTSL